jgi:PTH1 family peptidyl-tRNA hydrolase
MLEHRKAIDDSIQRAVNALPLLLAGDMEKAMVRIHTSKPPRPKPPRPVKAPTPDAPAAE